MLELKTPMEKFLHEDRALIMQERDQLKKDLEEIKERSKSTFNVYMYNLLEEGMTWCHPTHNATMIIIKDGVTIKLDPEEIKQVVKTAGGNFRR